MTDYDMILNRNKERNGYRDTLCYGIVFNISTSNKETKDMDNNKMQYGKFIIFILLFCVKISYITCLL